MLWLDLQAGGLFFAGRSLETSPNGGIYGYTIAGLYLPESYNDNPKDDFREEEKHYFSANKLNNELLKINNINDNDNGKVL